MTRTEFLKKYEDEIFEILEIILDKYDEFNKNKDYRLFLNDAEELSDDLFAIFFTTHIEKDLRKIKSGVRNANL